MFRPPTNLYNAFGTPVNGVSYPNYPPPPIPPLGSPGPLGHPVYQNHFRQRTPEPFAASPLNPFGPTAANRNTPFNMRGNSSADERARQFRALSMTTVMQLVKGVKDVPDERKMFSSEENDVGEKFVEWITLLSDEATGYDARLGPYFSLTLARMRKNRH